ncbi:MAG TPA: DUF362 domain-containing protein [Planctomycetota bacterium]|nr:DUF362 domain-containing protein [Planctomycetota bacterium]HRR81375.1 DUF362 domain-containing protein [Planctomycetota bacterium]HRT94545.1 DUF362 domain-containing protein [Planctomycetota bacterium]
MAKVAIVRCADYEPQRVDDAVRRALDLIGGLGPIVRPGQRVLLKPNLLRAAPPERAVTTHPTLIRSMAAAVREAGAQAWVGDSPGGIQWNVTDKVLAESGVGPAALEAGAEIKDFEAGGTVAMECPEAMVLKKFALARAVREADAVFSLAKLKTHCQTLYSGAVKNLLGCLPGGGKIRVHQLAPKSRQLWAAFLDIYAVVRPRLALIDGIVAMEGEGPSHGKVRPLGLLIASEDSVAADAVACRVIGYPPRAVKLFEQAEERGLGVGDLKQIEVVGVPIEEAAVRDFVRPSNFAFEVIPGFLMKLIGRGVSVKPEIVQELCKKCGMCQRSCPADAIARHEGLAIDPAKCVRCFCCHELCPHDAIALKRAWFIRLYDYMRHQRKRRKHARQSGAPR